MAKIHIDNGVAYFHCPGCQHAHGVSFTPGDNGTGHPRPVWDFNGDAERPTISPSIRCQSAILCHSYVTDGQIRFLSDCEHALAGQTVELPEFD